MLDVSFIDNRKGGGAGEKDTLCLNETNFNRNPTRHGKFVLGREEVK